MILSLSQEVSRLAALPLAVNVNLNVSMKQKVHETCRLYAFHIELNRAKQVQCSSLLARHHSNGHNAIFKNKNLLK